MESLAVYIVENGDKMKVEEIWSVRIKLHIGVNQTVHKVRFVSSVIAKIIFLLGEMTSQGVQWKLLLGGNKNEKNICYLEGQIEQDKWWKESKIL